MFLEVKLRRAPLIKCEEDRRLISDDEIGYIEIFQFINFLYNIMFMNKSFKQRKHIIYSTVCIYQGCGSALVVCGSGSRTIKSPNFSTLKP